MENPDKITIMLKEYGTLRQEILQRIRNRSTFLSIFGALGGVGIFQLQSLSNIQLSFLITSAVFAAFIWLQIGTVIARCARRIADIEEAVNEIVGEKLLRWESERIGSKAMHLFHKA